MINFFNKLSFLIKSYNHFIKFHFKIQFFYIGSCIVNGIPKGLKIDYNKRFPFKVRAMARSCKLTCLLANIKKTHKMYEHWSLTINEQ